MASNTSINTTIATKNTAEAVVAVVDVRVRRDRTLTLGVDLARTATLMTTTYLFAAVLIRYSR